MPSLRRARAMRVKLVARWMSWSNRRCWNHICGSIWQSYPKRIEQQYRANSPSPQLHKDRTCYSYANQLGSSSPVRSGLTSHPSSQSLHFPHSTSFSGPCAFKFIFGGVPLAHLRPSQILISRRILPDLLFRQMERLARVHRHELILVEE